LQCKCPLALDLSGVDDEFLARVKNVDLKKAKKRTAYERRR